MATNYFDLAVDFAREAKPANCTAYVIERVADRWFWVASANVWTRNMARATPFDSMSGAVMEALSRIGLRQSEWVVKPVRSGEIG